MPRFQDAVTLNCSFSSVVDFATPGCCLWTVPTGVTRLTFEIWGGGGGGGAACCCDCYRTAVGGGGGGYSRKTVTGVTGGSTQYTICVGGGGRVSTTGSCTLHWCCDGAIGCCTFVQGTGLTNFCAQGGCGGQNFCYYTCGCTTEGGCGYGGDVFWCGSQGTVGHSTNACMFIVMIAGGSPFGTARQISVSDACCRCQIGAFGLFPGGGGTSASTNWCCCCSQAGVGGNGLVRVHF